MDDENRQLKEDEIISYIKKYRELDDQRARDEEMVVLTKLIELDPYCETAYQGFHFNYYYNRGVLYGYLDEEDKALADYDKALEINPKHINARANRAVIYSDRKEFDRAIGECEICLAMDPDSYAGINLKTFEHHKIEYENSK